MKVHKPGRIIPFVHCPEELIMKKEKSDFTFYDS